MSEKRFTIESERINTTYSVRILKDDEVIFEISNWNSLSGMHKTECEDIVDLLNEQQDTINKLRKILAEAEDTIEVRLAEHYLKEYENIKHNIIGDNDE